MKVITSLTDNCCVLLS